ncbi:pentapeptide repeat-containing protein [Kibdelosporangium aridum]|uniref:Pentapeptide repeat-containing protein n=1 Tax=Kibdelosporangium aridum TaxID=2030 RepID=A0A428ZHG7_KIBAR|nr:pentapeptide repeat-containing protein [Kibdelosporangium aridum]RSM87505.1 pentapeptide repeat-containing protein [Kibdelosporangium aridum]
MTLRQVRANREGHSIELFTKAIDMLASDQVSVRHGGVYALEQLAELDKRYHGHAHALLTAFIRRHAPWPPTNTDTDPTAQPLHGGTFDDIGGALAALSRQAAIFDGWSELERVDLRGAELNKLTLPRVCFAHSNLDGATLIDTKLTDATLSDTTLRNTNLTRTDLRRADLNDSDLAGANLTNADLTGTDLTNANLTDADLTGAHLDGTILLGTNLTNAQLRNATLRDVVADHNTTWPHDYTPSPRALRKPAPRDTRIHETRYLDT